MGILSTLLGGPAPSRKRKDREKLKHMKPLTPSSMDDTVVGERVMSTR